jgi:uncharacterized membrane protein
MSGRLRILMVASLILNVFLIGIGIGVYVTGARITPAQAQRRPAPNIWRAAEALPPVERDRFRKVLRDRAAEVQPEMRSVRLARREAISLISQPNYDPAAVSAALGRARQGEMHARSQIDAGFVDYLAHLTPEQRTAVAEAMVRNRPGALRPANAGERGAAPPDAP